MVKTAYKNLPPLILFVFLLFLGACTAEPPLPTQAVLWPSATAVPPTPFTAVPTRSPTAATPSPLPPSLPPPTATPSPTATPIPPSPTACPPGRVQSGVFNSPLAGESRYRIYLPPCYGDDGRVYPTLYVFGGNTHDESAWDDYGVDEAAEAAIRQGQIPPLLIVMADGGWLANNSSGGPRSFEGQVMDYLIPHIEETTCAWHGREGRAIGGISRGGYWSLEIAFQHPHQFLSVGGHSPALIDSHAGPEINPQFTALSRELGDLRIYLDIGADDWLRPQAQRLHEDMAAQGIPHTWVLNEGSHEDAYWPPHLAEYLRWYAEPWPLDRNAYPARDCP